MKKKVRAITLPKKRKRKPWYKHLAFKFSLFSVAILGVLAIAGGGVYHFTPKTDVLGTSTKTTTANKTAYILVKLATGARFSLPQHSLFCLSFGDGYGNGFDANKNDTDCVNHFPAVIPLVYPFTNSVYANLYKNGGVIIFGGHANDYSITTSHAVTPLKYNAKNTCSNAKNIAASCTITVPCEGYTIPHVSHGGKVCNLVGNTCSSYVTYTSCKKPTPTPRPRGYIGL